ncbi:hypothetical protein NEOLEDRAFT_690927 [Neolentinus lepideus HHB14362 ss-1]|uniref:Uncharacterized protein n=1 Tax=Neolentinus lepideus HHB14362 ss-1 TaxID=1314782 RepID=A0A165V1G7_9AGAM|nr:hypothetical protein NEOLEDRAFT_690927 [Neolentinus lepideus HHB14362 ss-1]
MRSPETWNDSTLLQEEPLVSWFDRTSRDLVSTNMDQEEWEASLATKLQEEVPDAVAAWIGLALKHLPDDGQEAIPIDVDAGYLLFIRVYWLIFQERGNEAYSLLRSARQQRGIACDLPESVAGGQPQPQQPVAPETGLLKRRRNCKRWKNRSKSVNTAKEEREELDGMNEGSVREDGLDSHEASLQMPISDELQKSSSTCLERHIIDEPSTSAEVIPRGWDTDSTLTSLESSDESDVEQTRTLDSIPDTAYARNSRPTRAATNRAMITKLAHAESQYPRNKRRQSSFGTEDDTLSAAAVSGRIPKARKRPRLSKPSPHGLRSKASKNAAETDSLEKSDLYTGSLRSEKSSFPVLDTLSNTPAIRRITRSQSQSNPQHLVGEVVAAGGKSGKKACAKNAHKVPGKRAQERRSARLSNKDNVGSQRMYSAIHPVRGLEISTASQGKAVTNSSSADGVHGQDDLMMSGRDNYDAAVQASEAISPLLTKKRLLKPTTDTPNVPSASIRPLSASEKGITSKPSAPTPQARKSTRQAAEPKVSQTMANVGNGSARASTAKEVRRSIYQAEAPPELNNSLGPAGRNRLKRLVSKLSSERKQDELTLPKGAGRSIHVDHTATTCLDHGR